MNPEMLKEIFEICVIPILGALTVFVCRWISLKASELKVKTKNEVTQKYIDMLADTITQCVTATNQTYVEALKKQGKFDADAQKAAFQMTYNAVLAILNEEAKQYITEAVGDFSTYLTQQIEATVNFSKE